MLDRKRKLGIVAGASIIALWFLCRFFVYEEVVSDPHGGGHVTFKNTSLVVVEREENSNLSTNELTIGEEVQVQVISENKNKSNGIGSFHLPEPNPSAAAVPEPVATTSTTTTTTTDPTPVPVPVTSAPDPTPAPSIKSQDPVDPEDTATVAVRETQIHSYHNGTGLILNVHVTHHGGTAVCSVLRSANDVPTLDGYQSEVPGFACMGDNANISGGVYQHDQKTVPWIGQNETAIGISKARKFFHTISWEFGGAPKRDLHLTDWENPRLVSIFVIRHPLGRLLAGDGDVNRFYPGGLETEPNETLRHEYWWDYANGTNKLAKSNTNNYAMRVLSSNECCEGTESDVQYFQQAKALMKRFTVILDIDCLNDGLSELGKVLNVTFDCEKSLTCAKAKKKVATRKSYAERIGFNDVYQFLSEKNKYDIELYEWAKQRSLVKCNTGNDKTPAQASAQAPKTTDPQPVLSTVPTAQNQDIKNQQINNYRNGTALMLNLHLTHHGGTAFCQTVGRAESVPGGGTAPGFVCLADNENITRGIYKIDRNTVPWDSHDETQAWIKKIRPYFHMIAWEYGDQKPLPPKSLMNVNWEDPNLLSVMIIRHPIERILAADANVFKRYPGLVPKAKDVLFHHEYETNMTLRHQYWWDYANGTSVMSTRNSNNFALRILSDPEKCCEGKNTDRKYLNQAQSFLEKFTIILDQPCLNDGMEALGQMLNLTLSWKKNRKRDPTVAGAVDSSRPSSYRDRIGFDDVYEFLIEKNKLDIELYEWAKERSLVRCKT